MKAELEVDAWRMGYVEVPPLPFDWLTLSF